MLCLCQQWPSSPREEICDLRMPSARRCVGVEIGLSLFKTYSRSHTTLIQALSDACGGRKRLLCRSVRRYEVWVDGSSECVSSDHDACGSTMRDLETRDLDLYVQLYDIERQRAAYNAWEQGCRKGSADGGGERLSTLEMTSLGNCLYRDEAKDEDFHAYEVCSTVQTATVHHEDSRIIP